MNSDRVVDQTIYNIEETILYYYYVINHDIYSKREYKAHILTMIYT